MTTVEVAVAVVIVVVVVVVIVVLLVACKTVLVLVVATLLWGAGVTVATVVVAALIGDGIMESTVKAILMPLLHTHHCMKAAHTPKAAAPMSINHMTPNMRTVLKRGHLCFVL